jgi:hypothetical protein
MDDSGGGDPSSHCRALTHPCAQTVVGTCSVPDRNLHVLRLTKLRLLLGLTQHAAVSLRGSSAAVKEARLVPRPVQAP